MLISAEVIIHKFQDKSLNKIENKALIINTISLILVFIETTTIAIKDKGITYSRLREIGIEGPMKIQLMLKFAKISIMLFRFPINESAYI